MIDERQLATARLLAYRLERFSADSLWAHRASGLRSALLRCLEEIEINPTGERRDCLASRLDQLVERGFEILAHGAREISVPPEHPGGCEGPN